MQANVYLGVIHPGSDTGNVKNMSQHKKIRALLSQSNIRRAHAGKPNMGSFCDMSGLETPGLAQWLFTTRIVTLRRDLCHCNSGDTPRNPCQPPGKPSPTWFPKNLGCFLCGRFFGKLSEYRERVDWAGKVESTKGRRRKTAESIMTHYRAGSQKSGPARSMSQTPSGSGVPLLHPFHPSFRSNH